MKRLRKLTGAAAVLTLVVMIVALFRFHGEEVSEPGQQVAYDLDEGWNLVSLPASKDVSEMTPLVREALSSGTSQTVDLPYRASGEVLVFQSTLSHDFAGMTLVFSSAGAAVRVLLDGEVLFEYGLDAAADQAAGSSDYYVNMPSYFERGELWIELIASVPGTEAELEAVQIESRDMIMIGLVGGSVADIGCCLLMLFIAFVMFMLALIRRYTRQPQRGEVYLGLSGIAAGVYCFIKTDTLGIFYNLYEPYVMQEYLVVLVPLFLALYHDHNLRTRYPRRFSALLGCVSANALLQIALQVLGVWYMEDMVILSAAAISVVCAAAMVSLIQSGYENKRLYMLLPVSALAALLSGVAAESIAHVIGGGMYGSMAGQYGMTIYSVSMAALHILQLSKEYRESAEHSARLLEEKIKVTEQQNAQLALAKKDADDARHEALAANEAKGRFLANMSHEIRTPINAVLGMDEMILRETKEQQVKEYAMDIYTAGQTLLSLINDILDFSKIESGKMEIVPIAYDLSSMIHDLVNMAAQRAAHKDLCLEVTVDPQIPSRLYGDDVRIRQVLTNILTNAVKYTHEGTVWLRVQCRGDGGTVVLLFEVEDTGIGIRQEDLPKLYTEFERIEEDRNRSIEGTGLGMSITLQLLSLMGSRLQVESEYGKGSKFYFELEQKIVDSTPIGNFESRIRQIAEDYDYRSKFCAPDAKILVVDDNAANRKVFRHLLKETLVQVTDVESGMECLELVQKNRYDLIFLDHMMPDMDGVETLHRIKELPGCPCRDTPIIVLTANAVSGAKENYLSEGFDDFLSKPIVPDKLENMIISRLPEGLLKEAAADSKKTVPPAGIGGQAEAPDTLPQVDGLDWQYAWMHLPDMELLAYTVREFYGQIDHSADRLETFYSHIAEPGQTEQYRIQVHAMKSLAATVGILPLFGVAKLLEYAAKDGNIEVIVSVTPVFLREWRSYRGKLQGVFGIEETAKKEAADSAVILALVEMVRFSVQEMDIDEADRIMAQLQGYAYPDRIGGSMQKLAEAVTSLDVEAVEACAAVLAEQLAYIE
ncbi:MAG: response regulator [Lachnospiraceae bacterium]|jgi:signal transduction histidine kinase/ActR/RegA family two-component response regulator|nr:response regulator [Lachnospiraceae bacterium]